MSNSAGGAAKKKRAIHPVLLGVIVFVVMCGAILFNMFREAVLSRVFAPQWSKDFQKHNELAKTDKAAGIKAMEQDYAIGAATKGDIGEKMHATHELALWYQWTDRYDESRKKYLESAELARQLKSVPLDESNVLAECALLDHYNGKVKDGEALAERALQLKLKELGPDHEQDGWVQTSVAVAAMDAGHYPRAEKAWSEAVRVESKTKRHKGLAYIDATNGLACCYALEGKRELADKTFIDNIKDADSRWGIGNASTETIIADYARTLRQTGDLKSAELLMTRSADTTVYDSKVPRTIVLWD